MDCDLYNINMYIPFTIFQAFFSLYLELYSLEKISKIFYIISIADL